MTINRENNIEWLRLFFALQVMFVHIFQHIGSKEIPFLNKFPGVPAFFFLSGFLIYASYAKSNNLRQYFINRFLRIYPALVVVTIFGLILIAVAESRGIVTVEVSKVVIWFVSQVTIGQAFNPIEFRGIGVGVINGSLWTISVEILFYALIPLVFYLERKFKHTVLTIFILSFLVSKFGDNLFGLVVFKDKTIYDFLLLTPLTWLWMFMLGVIFYKKYELLLKHVSLYKYTIIPILFIAFLDLEDFLFSVSGNGIGLIYFALYCFLYSMFLSALGTSL